MEQAARAFSTMNKITPETRAKFSTMAAKRREEALINEANCIPPPPPSSLSQSSFFGNRRRYPRESNFFFELSKFNEILILFLFCFTRSFRNVAENAILYVGSQHGRLDQLSLVLFPLTFLLFTISYWIIYLNASKHRQSN